ncbi:MAG: type IV pilus biogenesis/stability protein PilW [Pseudoxanthomonas sp.]
MRLRSLALVGLMVLPLFTGCRAFMEPSVKTQGAEWVAPEYHVSDDAATTRRMASERRLSLVQQRLQSGDLKSAEAEAKAALKADPSSADALTFLAVIAARKGAETEAGGYYKRAAEAAPKQGGVLNNYGAWLCANGFPAESLVWFDRAISAPGYATPESALANAGGCALKTGQYERADRDLRNALSISPRNAYALASRAESEYRQGRYFEARAFTERRLAAAPASPAVLQLAADIEEKLGDKAAASRYVQRLRAEFPEVVTANPGEKLRP